MKERICKISLFSAILACVATMPTYGAVKTKNSNRSYADAYQQVNAMRYQAEYAANNVATTASATANLPVAVSDKSLAESILNNTADGVSVSVLDNCAMIYPNGVFKWEIPESGVRRNQVNQCVAVVELRDVKTNKVLATTTVAAGDTMKCNVDSFPESGLATDLKYGKIEVPADKAPTMEDVEAVMNEEQKQNAGLKIAAGALLGGVAGNFLAPKEAGDTKMFGAGNTQLIDTAIGTAAGAGIMAASSYSGKVAGDTIKSTAVNAASGMVIGNMAAGASGGDSVLSTTKCKIENDSNEYDCIVGTCAKKDTNGNIDEGTTTTDTKTYHYFIKKIKCNEILRCIKGADGKYINCVQEPTTNYINIKVTTAGNVDKECSLMKEDEFINIPATFARKTSDGTPNILESNDSGDGDFIKIKSADKVSKRDRAYAIVGKLKAKPFGYKIEDWEKEIVPNHTDIKYYYRNSNGTVGNEIPADACSTFDPSERDADDGALIDISNQARAKATLVGTAAGGAMGGFAAYQGAKTEVSERWTAAVREYEDSLSNFVCMTGGRYLSKYNDYIEIPELKIPDEQQ